MIRTGGLCALTLVWGAGVSAHSEHSAAGWWPMPNGMMVHESCIHPWEEAHLERLHEPCEFEPYPIANTTGERGNKGYYSGWSVYAQTTHSAGFGNLSSAWNVPAKPTSRGPAPPLISSSIYLFNGLEDGGGVSGAASLILQPVLQYGKSGCVHNPLMYDDWYLTSYLVTGSGRAYCGDTLGPLREGEEVVGTMWLTDTIDETWTVESVVPSTGDISTKSASLGEGKTLDAAYLTLETMVIYG